MLRIKQSIPNLITLGNLACGIMAVITMLQGNLVSGDAACVGWWMVGAMACDFLDGFAARALKASSPIGKELDSLSDMVSFGVVPGIMVYTVLRQVVLYKFVPIGEEGAPLPWHLAALPYIGLVIPLFSALRLAKFNVDTRQSYGFLGFPTPANTLFFLSVFLIFWLDYPHEGPSDPNRDYLLTPSAMLAQQGKALLALLYHPVGLPLLAIGFSCLLVTEIPLLAMKFKDYRWKGNWPRYVLILVSVPLLAVLWYRAIPLIIALYFLFSFIDTRIHQNTA